METKKCTKCKKTQDISFFVSTGKRKDETKTCLKCREGNYVYVKKDKKCTKCKKIMDFSFFKGRNNRETLICSICRDRSIGYRIKAGVLTGEGPVLIKHITKNGVECKKCSFCKKILPLDKYGKHPGLSDGLRSRCKECLKVEYHKASEAEKKIRAEKLKVRRKKWDAKNRDKLNMRAKERRAIDPQYRIKGSLRSRLRLALKDQGSKKSESTFDLIGCTYKFLLEYLESLFTEGMTWDNYGRNGWHIDHIRPCSSFDLTNKSEQYKCFHYTNLQPLWEIENIKKGNKWPLPKKCEIVFVPYKCELVFVPYKE